MTMHKYFVSSRKLVLMAALGLAGMLAHGCLWDSTLYDKFAGGNSCSGYCKNEIATDEACKDASGEWRKGSCIDDEGKTTDAADKTNCLLQSGKWNEAQCILSSKAACEAEGVGGQWSPLAVIELGQGRYARLHEDGNYTCDTYNALRDNNMLENCLPDDIKFVKQAFEYELCPTSAQHCVEFRTTQGETSPPVGACSKCSLNQASCLSGDSWLCVDIMNNPKHCGKCENACEGNNFCDNGVCTARTVTCEPGNIVCFCANDSSAETICHSERQSDADEFVCFNPTAPATCGAKDCANLGMTCPAGFLCEKDGDDYTCRCPKGLVQLGEDDCVSPYAHNHCGITEISNGTSCQADEVCDGENCQCQSGLLKCGEACVDFLENPKNCGKCGTACGENEVCLVGRCRCETGYARCSTAERCVSATGSGALSWCGAKGECISGDENSNDYKGIECGKLSCSGEGQCECNAPNLLCDDGCITNPLTNNAFCGAMSCVNRGDDCTKFKGSTCRSGVCACPNPAYEQITTIDGVKGCYDTRSEPKCCGPTCMTCASNEICTLSGTIGMCQNIPCPSGTIKCDGRCLDPNVAHVEQDGENRCKCSMGRCDTDGNPNNGCDGGRLGDENNCGACNYACSAPFGACQMNTMFEFSCICADGLTQCMSNNGSGVKVEMCLDLNALNMKSCEVCQEDWANINGDWSDGCETYLKTDLNHCGLEGNDCTTKVKNAIGITCKDGQCDYLSCQAGYGNCNGDRTDGCEAPINTTQNCGVCKNSCQVKQECKTETAGVRCCYPGGVELSSGIARSQCCEGLKLWRRNANVMCWVSEAYQCATSAPSGCGWSEVK